MIVIITPCLLGFDVKTQAAPNGFVRPVGVFATFTPVLDRLLHTEQDFTVVVK